MWEQYWQTYFDVTADACYYDHYAVHARRRNGFISAICFVATSSSVALLLTSTGPKSLWSILFVIAQIVMIIRPVFPFEKQQIAANYIAKELHGLEMELKNWILDITDETTDEDYVKQIKYAREKNDEIQFRFANAETFPKNKKLMKIAEDEAYQMIGGQTNDTNKPKRRILWSRKPRS